MCWPQAIAYIQESILSTAYPTIANDPTWCLLRYKPNLDVFYHDHSGMNLTTSKVYHPLHISLHLSSRPYPFPKTTTMTLPQRKQRATHQHYCPAPNASYVPDLVFLHRSTVIQIEPPSDLPPLNRSITPLTNTLSTKHRSPTPSPHPNTNPNTVEMRNNNINEEAMPPCDNNKRKTE